MLYHHTLVIHVYMIYENFKLTHQVGYQSIVDREVASGLHTAEGGGAFGHCNLRHFVS